MYYKLFPTVMLQDIQLPIRQINNFQKQRLIPTCRKTLHAIFQTTRHKAIKIRENILLVVVLYAKKN